MNNLENVKVFSTNRSHNYNSRNLAIAISTEKTLQYHQQTYKMPRIQNFTQDLHKM